MSQSEISALPFPSSVNLSQCIRRGSPEKRNQLDCMCVNARVCMCTHVSYYKEVARVIMEADKPEDRRSASWRPKRVCGVVPVRV